MNKYEIFCEISSQCIPDKHTVTGSFYDVIDGRLDIYISGEEVIATFEQGYWKAIISRGVIE